MINGTDLELEIEALVDKHTLTEVLNSLQGVCGLKADHIRENWPGTNSEPIVKAWETAASAIEKAWDRARRLAL